MGVGFIGRCAAFYVPTWPRQLLYSSSRVGQAFFNRLLWFFFWSVENLGPPPVPDFLEPMIDCQVLAANPDSTR